MRNDTAQELDPLSGLTARLFAIGAVVVALVVAFSLSVITAEQTNNWWFEAAALAAISASGYFYVRAASPFRAPFPRRAHAVVCLLALLAVVLEAGAQWGTNSVVRDDWAPVSLAILTLTFGSWRPGWEILACTAVCAVVIGALAYARSATFAADVPAIVFAVLAATPVLAAGAAASSFSRSLVDSLLAWRSGVARPQASAPDASDLAPSARASHLVHLDEQVYPFLERVARQPELTVGDGERARMLARELRTLLVLDAERSWLSRIVRGADDRNRFAERLGEAERGYLRALVSHIRTSVTFDDERMRVMLHGNDWEATCTIVVPCRPSHNPRVQLAPYVAVGRSVFGTVSWNLAHDNTLTITMTFDPNANHEETL
ncbi:hypothetical protein [Conyzicola sp.]|uniref:hypothetical protein n=1 Tax=Conyzicola sp. TaxID=1969404 RepID=UPI003988F8F3